MGYGIQFKTNIYLSKRSFSSIYELRYAIVDVKELISNVKEEIMMYSAASIDQCFPKDEQPVRAMQIVMSELIELLENYTLELHNLHLLEQYLEENPEVDINSLLK